MIKRSTLSRLRAAAWLAAPAVLLLPSSLCLAAPPANDSFADAATLVTGTPLEGTNWEATMEPGEPVPEGYDEATYARTVWWSWTAPATGRFDFSTKDTSFRTVVAVWTGTSADALTPVPEADGGTGGGAATTRARIMAVEGTVYHISVAGWGNDFHNQGPIVLRAAASPLPPNDHFADRLPLTTGTAWRGPIAGATREAWEPVLPSGEKENGSLWFSWTALHRMVRAQFCRHLPWIPAGGVDGIRSRRSAAGACGRPLLPPAGHRGDRVSAGFGHGHPPGAGGGKGGMFSVFSFQFSEVNCSGVG